MNNEIQKASMLKRISAFTFDMILLVCLVVALAFGISAILGYDGYHARMDEKYEQYGQMFGIDVNISMEQFDALSEAEQARYNEAVEAINQDEEATKLYSMIVNLTLVIATVSILLAYVGLELVVPLLFGNGQTLGKKIFGIALMRLDGVKVTPFMLFVRTVLGKFTVETMIPVLLIIMLLFGFVGGIGTLIIGLILLVQVILLIATRTHSVLHDMLACTVVVDLASQRIFDSPEARVEYMKRLSAEAAARAEY